MSNKVAIISPARNEKYLPQTVESCLSNATGEIEFIAVLEGYEPEGWANLTAKYSNLHTIYHSTPQGMRKSINDGAASAISRGAKYLMKLDAHCLVPEGFDTVLKADCDSDWIVVPRRKRLDVENWAIQDVGKPDIDYHYLSFPDDPKDFGGPGLNGKVWTQRALERIDIEIDDEMSSQGSGWFMHADYFTRLELMDEKSYGPFWSEFQELGNKCWLSGGQVKVNKKTWYAHWHKGKSGRGYSLPESWLKQGRNHSMRWLYNEAWPKQMRPFKWLIEHFWPVPTWPENWEEMVYGAGQHAGVFTGVGSRSSRDGDSDMGQSSALTIHSATYGIGSPDDLDVTQLLQSKVANNSLDMMVTNSDLEVGNPFRGQKKRLVVSYTYNGQELATKTVHERDWLIIGQSQRYIKLDPVVAETPAPQDTVAEASGGDVQSSATVVDLPDENWVRKGLPPMTAEESKAAIRAQSATALNDLLIRRFHIPSHRLRGPMPIEVPSFHRNDLAQLFAELQFNHGAEIGVAEGNYSEVLVNANPNLQLLCIDPWHGYDGNKQHKSRDKHEYAYRETERKLQGSRARLIAKTSMDAVREVADGSLDFVYIDANHSFDFVMEDVIAWSRKVRSGGIISGDDFYYLDPKRWGAGPVEAVMAYTQAHRINPWFIFNAHKSVDFMWIKP